ncbi:efflux RND transporter permease subunit [Rhodospirillum rubrum]|uniref:Acriflavin resistance protein n=1 Tax=Rhodospirillum rubrum (strain ATCC 11170 / ATH 1.1.1 / DSM 467 / LMG 4362 / NCIMB 8255 / S1) TaxID=269796 RepID=Q2RSK1_RHORT|nr:efflux RND transporter permease subunit [Rhodospirillum rubrum]ABC22894.1 Acriflavin resistance protein [Rhodospirillum rubrum ATCC 11170]AEO48617.1 acriflavin resistance protein [Rhodospirillum rubrum F11]MBK5954499.1 AcrB/AcrD/AcrF family protein [Rhodospirillum rubrum]QXG78881.1 efflux RND transporter permease subunit [Rhodospirillum rubrum]HAP98784.1 AcrB/AcrD/AcrF family protein [Rhodospirillum rubrum]
MDVSSLFIRRPVFATVLSLLLVVMGIAAMTRLAVRELPDIDSAVVSVTTPYTGAAPEIVDTDITEVIENAVAGVSGIRTITSQSRRGQGRTVIEFESGVSMDEAVNDVRDAVAKVRGDLPDDIEEPRIAKSDTDSDPVMRLSLTSPRMTPIELTDFADRYIVDRLATIDGVAQVDLYGERRQAIRLWLDRRAMAARQVTVQDVEAALRRANVELPAGEIESASRLLTVRAATLLTSPEAFGSTVIKVVDGYPLRVRDVARVELGVENDDTTVRVEGRDALTMGVLRQSQANTVAISNRIRAEIDRLRPSLPEGMSLEVSSDDALFINRSIHEVILTLGLSGLIVIIVNFAFLGSIRATLVPTVTIPVAVIGTFIGILLLGFSINLLTLLALILSIGLVVDDAIVVLENIQRRIEAGEPKLVAAARGTRQVTFAVVATSLTLIAVFVPISFMEGTVGRLFTEFGFVLACAVAISMLVALTLCPPLAAGVLAEGKAEGRLAHALNYAFGTLSRGYQRALSAVLGLPMVVLTVALLCGGASFWLYQGLPKELVPVEDRGVVVVSLNGPQGANTRYTDTQIRAVEAAVQPVLDRGEAVGVLAQVGQWNRPHRGYVVIRLDDWENRGRTASALAESLRKDLGKLAGATATPVVPAGLGLRGSRTPLQVVIGGPDYAEVEVWANALLKRAEELPGLINPELDFEQNQPQLSVGIDRDRADDLGVGVEAIGQTLQTMLASREVTRFVDRGREYQVVVQARPEDRRTPSDLSNTFVRAEKGGALVPLDALVILKETAGAPDLNRYARLPSITLQSALAPGYDMGQAIDDVMALASQTVPPEARLSLAGQSKEFLETSGGVLFTFLMALVIVYLVLAAQFESFLHPLIIMLSVPLAVSGALLSLWATGNSINVYSQIGIVLLIGLTAKNGILIVEFANQLRDEGRSVREAILEAASLRLRPILMTVICTILGAVPLAWSSGAGAESREAIGIVVIGGLGLASLLTLFVTPVLYDLLAPFTRSAGAVGQALDRALAETPEGAGKPAE